MNRTMKQINSNYHRRLSLHLKILFLTDYDPSLRSDIPQSISFDAVAVSVMIQVLRFTHR